jgi:hypothetical protein
VGRGSGHLCAQPLGRHLQRFGGEVEVLPCTLRAPFTSGDDTKPSNGRHDPPRNPPETVILDSVRPPKAAHLETLAGERPIPLDVALQTRVWAESLRIYP